MCFFALIGVELCWLKNVCHANLTQGLRSGMVDRNPSWNKKSNSLQKVFYQLTLMCSGYVFFYVSQVWYDDKWWRISDREIYTRYSATCSNYSYPLLEYTGHSRSSYITAGDTLCNNYMITAPTTLLFIRRRCVYTFMVHHLLHSIMSVHFNPLIPSISAL